MARRYERSSGLLLHPTSLPGPHGIGDLGPEAYRFVDFLAAARQRLWQILPLGPTGFGNSPYAARSAFAGNPLLISLELLEEEGLLRDGDLDAVPDFPADRVDFAAVERFKMRALRRAAERFAADAPPTRRAAYDVFARQNARWLDDFALFMALQQSHGGAWQSWGEGLARRKTEALAEAREMLASEIALHSFAQFVFAEQWSALRQYASEHDVRVVGDIPIFVALESADVWSHPELFILDDRGFPTVVAGVPPDYFSATGQRWGNPLYRWDVIRERRYRWWVSRFRAAFRFADVVRVDHFRGFAAYWEIPAGEPTAVHGRWMPGPGRALFDAIRETLGDLPLVAEDLGFITPEVHELRRAIGVPGMKILQFAFAQANSPHLPHCYDPLTVVYTGTHDNDTALGWFLSAAQEERELAATYL